MDENNQPQRGADWIGELNENVALTSQQKAAITDWLRESPTHVRELVEHTFLQADLKRLQLDPETVRAWLQAARSDAAGGKVLPLADHRGSRLVPPLKERSRWLRRASSGSMWRTAVAACLLAVLLVGATRFLHWRAGMYTTAFGEQRSVTLADGSVVTLNTDSQMQVDFSGQRRFIRLVRGEAYFRVAHDVARPFLVSAPDTVVRAVGTRFNVRIAPGNTVVSVTDGVVKVGSWSADELPAESVPVPESDGRVVTVSKGEQVEVLHPDGQATTHIARFAGESAAHATAWTEGRLDFEDTRLVDVLAEFGRYRRLTVRIESESVRELKMTGSFDAYDLDSVLAYIGTIPGLTVQQIGTESFVIRRR